MNGASNENSSTSNGHKNGLTDSPTSNGHKNGLTDSPTSNRHKNGLFPPDEEKGVMKKLEINLIDEDGMILNVRRGMHHRLSMKELRCSSICSFEDDAMYEAAAPESRVLVIYTGGTIGMMRDNTGALRPFPGALARRVRNLPQMHDADYANRVMMSTDRDWANDLVLPIVDHGHSHRIVYNILEWDELIDSSDMSIDGWIRIAKDIESNYLQYNGFVVLHGTDTMAYTASALSFMFENLGKSVVLTGSQIPIFEPRSDGADNLVSALIIASTLDIPEVTLYFGNRLYRGNRTSKVSADNFDAFHSPNCDPLVTTGISLEVNSREIFRPSAIAAFKAHTSLVRDVAPIRIFPSISCAAVRAYLQPPIKGVVLETYGAGNIPANRHDIHEELKKAVERGILIVNITQCSRGSVKILYKTGQFVSDCGIVSGFDMTPEAALTKLSYVLSKDEWDFETKRKMMETNIRGELSNGSNRIKDFSIIDAVGRCVGVNNSKEATLVAESTVLPALLSYAAVESKPELVDDLQGFGADVCTSNYDGRSALHVAATVGEIGVMEKLLQYGTNVHLKDRYGNTPLLDAIHCEHPEAIDTLLKCGAHLGSAEVGRVAQEMCAAAARGLTVRLALYKRAGANLECADQSGRTPLHMAALLGHEETVKYLLSEGLSPETQDSFGLTCIDYAENGGFAKILSIFNNSAIIQ